MRRSIAAAMAVAVSVGVSAAAAEAQPAGPEPADPEVVVQYGSFPEELPEGVAAAKSGNVYVSLGPPFFVGGGYGAVERIARDGTRTTIVEHPGAAGVAGLAVSPDETLYYALPDPGQPDAGVYRVVRDRAVRIAGTEVMLVPNGLALDKSGDLYAGDSLLGEIWRAPDGLGPAETWLAHPLLAGCQPDQVGVNGIAFWRGDLYAANTFRGVLLRIPIGLDDTPGTPEVVAGDEDCDPTDELFGMDGIAFDVHGRVYAPLVLVHELVAIDPVDGAVEHLLDASDGLWNPASVAFGTGAGTRQQLFVTNYAVLPPVPPANLGPALLGIDVGVPGLPVP